MLKRQRKLLKKIIVLIVICTIVSCNSICLSVEDYQSEYTLPLKHGDMNVYLDVMKKGDIWLVEAQSLAELSNCQIQTANNKVTLSRGEPSIILYEAEPDVYISVQGKIYLPFKDATTAVGIYFYERSNMLAINKLKVPKELRNKIQEVFSDNRLLLSRMQNDLGWIWSTAETTAKLYSILPFVGSYSFVGAITGENEIQQYEEGFGHILSNEGTVYETVQKISDFDQAITDSTIVLELAEELTDQGSVLEEYANSNGIDQQLIYVLQNQYPAEGYEAGIKEWLSAYTDATTAVNLKYILDVCALYTVTMDAEESMLAAIKSAFEFCGNYNAKVASERIINRRCGSEMNTLKDFYKG